MASQVHPFDLNSDADQPLFTSTGPLVHQPTASTKKKKQEVPPGLEYLTMVDQILVHQKVEILEMMCGCETKNKYHIKNSIGQVIFTAEEDTACCNRNCLGRLRPFNLKIKDNDDREVMNIYREFRCDSCLCPCCLQILDVSAPPDTLIGRVVQEWSILTPEYSVQDASGEILFNVSGPCLPCSCCQDVEFPVTTPSGEHVGNITKQWSGLGRETFTDADHFGITFTLNLDVGMKALLLGACFLIDFNYFQSDNK